MQETAPRQPPEARGAAAAGPASSPPRVYEARGFVSLVRAAGRESVSWAACRDSLSRAASGELDRLGEFSAASGISKGASLWMRTFLILVPRTPSTLRLAWPIGSVSPTRGAAPSWFRT